MKIKMTISTQSLGNTNSADDNQRYADAVRVELQSEYPNADVYVELVANVSAGNCWVSDDTSGDVEEKARLIANQVWDKAAY